jgi:hypothetical protein
VEDFCRAMVTLYHDEPARERLAKKGREFMDHRYSPNAVVGQYDELLKRLVAR